MNALISTNEWCRYQADRTHDFAHDFTAEPVTLVQAVLLAAFHEWQGNDADRRISAPAERLALMVNRMRLTPALLPFSRNLPTGILVVQGRGPLYRFDDWAACCADKRREHLLQSVREPTLTADGLRIGNDLVSGQLDPRRYQPVVIELFGTSGLRTAFMDIVARTAPEKMPLVEVDDLLSRIIRRAIR